MGDGFDQIGKKNMMESYESDFWAYIQKHWREQSRVFKGGFVEFKKAKAALTKLQSGPAPQWEPLRGMVNGHTDFSNATMDNTEIMHIFCDITNRFAKLTLLEKFDCSYRPDQSFKAKSGLSKMDTFPSSGAPSM